VYAQFVPMGHEKYQQQKQQQPPTEADAMAEATTTTRWTECVANQ